MASTVEKTNINNVKVNQNGGKNMTVIEQFKKKNFSWKNISFEYLVPFHVVHTLRNVFRNCFTPLLVWQYL